MLNEAQIKRVWEGMLGADIRANYFADLTERYNHRQQIATWGTLFLSSGALAAIMATLPPGWIWIRPVLAAATTGLSLYSLVQQNYRRATDAADLHLRWNKLSYSYEKLWEDITAENAARVLDELAGTSAELSKAGTSFPNDERTMLKWENHVVSHRLQPHSR